MRKHSEATTNYHSARSGSSKSHLRQQTTLRQYNNNSYTGDTRTVIQKSASAPGISAMSQDLCTVGVNHFVREVQDK